MASEKVFMWDENAAITKIDSSPKLNNEESKEIEKKTFKEDTKEENKADTKEEIKEEKSRKLSRSALSRRNKPSKTLRVCWASPSEWGRNSPN